MCHMSICVQEQCGLRVQCVKENKIIFHFILVSESRKSHFGLELSGATDQYLAICLKKIIALNVPFKPSQIQLHASVNLKTIKLP